MTWNRPGFARKAGKVYSSIVDIIHEMPGQRIQGGRPGEHYHLDATQLGLLFARLANFTSLEPVMTVPRESPSFPEDEGMIITALNGDIVMGVTNTPYNTPFNSDIQGPVIVPPTPGGDELWEYVTLLVPTGPVDTSPINVASIGGDVFSYGGHARYSNLQKRFGLNAVNMGASLTAASSSSEGFGLVFTHEVELKGKFPGQEYQLTSGYGIGKFIIFKINTDGEAVFQQWDNIMYVGQVMDFEHVIVGAEYPNMHIDWHSLCVERDIDGRIRCYVNGEMIYDYVFPNPIANTFYAMHSSNQSYYYANWRATLENARYQGDYVPATQPFPQG